MNELQEIMRGFWKSYHKYEEFSLFSDLIIQIMSKGYYPMIHIKAKQPVVEKTGELCFKITHPIDKDLILYTASELRELDIDPTNYQIGILQKLEEQHKHLQSSASKVKE